MEINWFQIVAQMVNFFILLFLLNRLFYKPVASGYAGPGATARCAR
jgi:F0F1-type ATP synthase membrane subunit b/b'